MKHWFVDWLESQIQMSMDKAQQYRDALVADTPQSRMLREAFEDDWPKGLEEWIIESEEQAERLEKWRDLSADLVSCGLAELALKYYDAKQAINPALLPPRPNKSITWVIDGLAEQLETMMQDMPDNKVNEELKIVYLVLVELSAMAMKNTALVYYLRRMSENPELNLPEPEVYIEK